MSAADKALFTIFAMFFALIASITYVHNLPNWCKHIDKPNSGNWMVKPMCKVEYLPPRHQ